MVNLLMRTGIGCAREIFVATGIFDEQYLREGSNFSRSQN
jgi:hypothetical protein